MILLPPVTISIDRVLYWAGRIGVFFAAGIGGIMLIAALIYSGDSSESVVQEGAGQGRGKLSLAYETIGLGPLALRPSYAQGWVARLVEELAWVAYNSRPDVQQKDTPVLVALKQGKQQCTVINGKTLYLRESDEGKGLIPSEEATGLWIKPIVLDTGSVLMEVGRQWGQTEEKGQFIASVQSMRSAAASPDYAQPFRGAALFAHDLLLQKYGGSEYGALGHKGVLDLGAYAIAVSEGDSLLYDGGHWRQSDSSELTQGVPVAKVRSVTDKGLEIDVWDESGFFPSSLRVEMRRPQHPPFGPDAMPASIRLRTGTQVSCAFGKRRFILKQGDWLLKTASGWRTLRSAEDVQLYLERKIRGDLFVFEQIEKDPQGKHTLKGTLFDDTRTYMQQVSLPINLDKQQSKTSRKRRGARAIR